MTSRRTVVTLYMLPEFNAKLRRSGRASSNPGTRVVSHDYPWKAGRQTAWSRFAATSCITIRCCSSRSAKRKRPRTSGPFDYSFEKNINRSTSTETSAFTVTESPP